MMDLWVATTSQGKLNEIKNLTATKGIVIHSPLELKVFSAPPETGKTFADNARIKANNLRALRPGVWVVADDSGLEVDGLQNMPGVYSARYAGDRASDAENNAKVLKMLSIRSPLKRDARFHCVLIAYDPDGKEHQFEATIEGTIAEKARGTAGFGYDSIFIPKGESLTFAELGIAVKNKISHRAQAIRMFIERILQ
jgi:XTP/dITP diphosphohydrolase